MKLIKTLALTLLIFLIGELPAQDIHWTLYNMSPLTLNPALTGSYEGTFRIGGIYRDQYRNVVTNAFSTPSAFVDAPVFMVGKRHWVGVGAMVFQDQAGTGKLTTSAFQFSGAFHLALDKKSQTVLTLGVQGGQVTRKLKNLNGLRTQEMILTGNPNAPLSQDLLNIQEGQGRDPEKPYTDINAGLLLKSKISKTASFEIGFSARHITKPEYNFETDSTGSNNRIDDFKLGRRFIAHTKADFDLTDKWTLSPTAYYTNLTPASQFQLQALAGYHLNPVERIKLNFGLGYRFSDAGQILLGIDYKDFRAMASYDVTLSALNQANNYQGGFEISVWYIAKIFKKPDVKPVIICPHL